MTDDHGDEIEREKHGEQLGGWRQVPAIEKQEIAEWKRDSGLETQTLNRCKELSCYGLGGATRDWEFAIRCAVVLYDRMI
ncbi:hypothetical protein [Haladaptatus halobius]|uniref:hypothetical protein n=1 Tax=Haladaptatus halobius TaxID=2884875 RepID=UPI001D0B9A09|nr:hypothetical protein [Haladaptatus halobius]